MDQQLKERLVGAAVLVALTAIFVPMVLDGPAPPAASVPTTLAPAPVDASTFGYDLTAPLPGAPATQAAVATPKPVTPPATTPNPAATTAAPAVAVAAAPAKPKPEVAAPKAATPKTSAAPSNGAWAAQVGSFTERATAEGIAAKLKSDGFKAFVMEHRVGGKAQYRVRVGPVATREAADELGKKITLKTGQAARPVRHP